MKIPYQFFAERYFTPKRRRSPFVQHASPFQDFIIRCIRYSFASFPPKIGRVFLSKGVALPFLQFRMLRHGFLKSPIQWREIKLVSLFTHGICGYTPTESHLKRNTAGLWITRDESQKSDLVIYYCHGMIQMHPFLCSPLI